MKIKLPDNSKMEELILYVAQESEKDPTFGAVKLNKILFYADFLSYRRRGKSITGQVYFALPEGPAPKLLVPIRNTMEKRKDIAIKHETKWAMAKPQQRIVALREPDYDKLDAQDIVIVNEVIEKLRGKTGRELSDKSHTFSGWMAAFAKGEKTTIPYASVLFDSDFWEPEPEPVVPEKVLKRAREIERELGIAA